MVLVPIIVTSSWLLVYLCYLYLTLIFTATSHKLYAFTFNAHVQKVNRDIEVFLGFCFPESREIFGSLRGRIFVVY